MILNVYVESVCYFGNKSAIEQASALEQAILQIEKIYNIKRVGKQQNLLEWISKRTLVIIYIAGKHIEAMKKKSWTRLKIWEKYEPELFSRKKCVLLIW